MADAAREPERWTLEQFLAYDDGTDTRYELHDGVIVAMAPPSGIHGMLMIELGATIRGQLERPCRVAAEVGIMLPERADTYYQADLVVTCSPLAPDGRIADPVIVVEVLSPSTAATDVLRKLPDYRALGSVQDILLVSSTGRQVEHWRRERDGWKVTDHRDDGSVRLQALPVTIDLRELYEGILPIEPAA